MLNPTPAACWRRTAVRPVLDAYAATEGVDAVMVSGSTARGDADRWSDVEVGVFWSHRPTAEDRAAVVRPAQFAEIRMVTRDDADPPWYDHGYLRAQQPDGLMVEVVHALTNTVEEILDNVLGSCHPDPAGLDVIKGIVDGREVSGDRGDAVARWQNRAQEYPRGLAVAVVQRNGGIDQFWRWQMLVERDNPLLLAREFFRITIQILNVLHALNGRYCGHASAFKRIDGFEQELPIAPPGLAARLRSVFTSAPPEGAAVLRSLVEETFDLVEARLPEVDVEQLRRRFRSERRPVDTLPATSGFQG